MSDPIRGELRHDGQLLHLTLDALKGNVLDTAMLGAIEAALDRHGHGARLKVILFEGAGRHFSFGASVEEHQADQVAAMLSRFHGLFLRLSTLAVPTCAIVRGQCLGGGLELAAYCSFLFAAPDAVFGQPEIKLAVFPPMASILLPWRVGGGAALDLCVSGRSIDAAEALRIGLASSVDEDPAAAFDALFSRTLAGTSASSLRFAERAVRLPLADRLERDLPRLERLYLDELMATPDANEGIAAFLQKRAPSYAGAIADPDPRGTR
jgi:cyclohexa-1,5-dienecarbonyl-CoA hydratase